VFYLDNKIGRFWWQTNSADILHDRRQNFVGRFYWQTKLSNFIVRLTSALEFDSSCRIDSNRLLPRSISSSSSRTKLEHGDQTSAAKRELSLRVNFNLLQDTNQRTQTDRQTTRRPASSVYRPHGTIAQTTHPAVIPRRTTHTHTH